jgi:hypothetical protein
MTIAAAGHIVYQIDTAVIYGAGKTAEEAWTDAKEWRNEIASDSDDRPSLWPDRYAAVKATAALMREVEESGGDIRWTEIEGVACTKAEAEEAA